MNVMQILGIVIMGGLTLFSLMLLGAAWGQPAGGTGEAKTDGGSRKLAVPQGWGTPVALLLYVAVAIEVVGLGISLNGYRTRPLVPIHALYIVAAVVVSAMASMLLYVSNQTLVQRFLSRRG